MTFDRQDQLKYTNAVKRVSFSLNFLSLYFNPLCVMKCLYFRPLFKYFEVLRVHSDMILFLMNEKSWMCYQTSCVICVTQAMVSLPAYG